MSVSSAALLLIDNVPSRSVKIPNPLLLSRVRWEPQVSEIEEQM